MPVYRFQVRHRLLKAPVHCATAEDVVCVLHALQALHGDPDSIGEAIPCPAQAEPAPAEPTGKTGAG
jgi:hypothetical protein